MHYCLHRLEGVRNRIAIFRTAVVILSPRKRKYEFYGVVRGSILEAPRTEPLPDMPYSALFVPDGQQRSLAEMNVQERNNYSHRGKAFSKARQVLELPTLQALGVETA